MGHTLALLSPVSADTASSLSILPPRVDRREGDIGTRDEGGKSAAKPLVTRISGFVGE